MKTAQQQFEFKQKSLFYGTDFMNGMRRILMSSLALIYFLSLGFDIVSVTSLFAISGVFLIAFEFITGPIADHVSRKLSVVISFVLMGTAFFGLFAFRDFWILAFFWILNDIAWTFQSGANTAWIIDTLNYGKHKANLARLFSRVYFFEKSGRVIGSLIGLIVVAISFRSVWLAISLANFLMAFILWKNMEERNFKPNKSKKNLILKTWFKTRQALVFLFHSKHKEFRGMIFSMILATLGAIFFYTTVPLVLKEVHQLSPDHISGLFMLIGIVLLAGPFIGERAFHRWGIRNSMFFGFLLLVLGKICFTLTGSVIFAAMALAFLETIGIATDVVFDTTIQHKIKSHVRASIGSAMSIIWTIAVSSAMALTGVSIKAFGLTTTLWVSIVFSTATAISYRYFIKERR